MSGERCDVAVVGAGLVGLSLAYELACLGASVTVDRRRPSGAGDRRRGGHPVAAHQRRGRPGLWPFLRQAGRALPGPAGPAGGRRRRRRRDGLRPLRHPLHRPARDEDDWFAPFAEVVLRRSPGEVVEITPEEASSLFPPLGPVHRVLHAPASARVDGRGMAAALRQAAAARGVAFVAGAAHGVVAGRRGGRAMSRRSRWKGTRTWPAVRWPSPGAPGPRPSASGSARACPSGPTKGQIVHLGVGAETGEWPIVQPLLTHYLVPWPGGRVACGGTFEAAAGFSVSVTAAGLHELLRECLTVAPGLHGADYLETRVGLRPTSADDRAVVGGCRAGATPGWPPGTGPTACCRAFSARAWRTPWPASTCRRTRRRCRRRSIPGASPEADRPHHPPGRGRARGDCGRAARDPAPRRRRHARHHGERAGRPGREPTSSGSTSTTRRRTAPSATS